MRRFYSSRRILITLIAWSVHMNRNESICSSVLSTIGNTPIVDLHRLVQNTKGVQGRILAKVEFLNPGYSKKDRIALQMIEEAESSGILKPGQTVIELTSGNTGTGLAIVCAAKGYPLYVVMSKGNSPERARMMKALGAHVVLVDQAPGSRPGQVSGESLALVGKETERLTKELGFSRGPVSSWRQLEGSLPPHWERNHRTDRWQVRRLLRFCWFRRKLRWRFQGPS